jgi:hypothetical protein
MNINPNTLCISKLNLSPGTEQNTHKYKGWVFMFLGTEKHKLQVWGVLPVMWWFFSSSVIGVGTIFLGLSLQAALEHL